MNDSQQVFRWPTDSLTTHPAWTMDYQTGYLRRRLDEDGDSLKLDSRWPAFFPVTMCLITTGNGTETAIEREVGAAIVNRFPYVIAVSICRETLSDRHHARNNFCRQLEFNGSAAVQFIEPVDHLKDYLQVIETTPEDATADRISAIGKNTRSALSCSAPVFDEAYLVYEAHLVRPETSLDGRQIYQKSWEDVGSHRIYFLEISIIQLCESIARIEKQILWQSLPRWDHYWPPSDIDTNLDLTSKAECYVKGYRPDYYFPNIDTIGFQFNEVIDGMAVRQMELSSAEQVIMDNDDSRWPCFFPSVPLLITSYAHDGTANVMPCGSTTVVSRHPFVVAVCLSASNINQRYKERASLSHIRERGFFGCTIPFDNPDVISAINYAGNVSYSENTTKVSNAGLEISDLSHAPVPKGFPVHLECQVVGERDLGTHIMVFGKVIDIYVHPELSTENQVEWLPWATLVEPSSSR